MDLFNEQERNQLRDSFLELIPHIDQIAESFYERLFTDFPSVRQHFRSDMASQREKLVDTIAAILDVLDRPVQAELALRKIGKVHSHYGADEAVYGWVERTFVQILKDMALGAAAGADSMVINSLWPRLMHFVVVNMQEGSHTH